MHNIYYLGLSGEHRCPLGYLSKSTYWGSRVLLLAITFYSSALLFFLVPRFSVPANDDIELDLAPLYQMYQAK